MKTSQRLSTLYRIWAKEIWKLVTDHLSAAEAYTWSYFSSGSLVFVKVDKSTAEQKTRCIGLTFGENSMTRVTFQCNDEREKVFSLPMQFVLENLDILKDFLMTGTVPERDHLEKMIKEFDTNNKDWFEKELNYAVIIQP